MKLFVPVENISDYACYSVYDRETIRAYRTMPRVDSSSDYTDFFVNSHYLEKTGTQTWSNYYSNLPVCVDNASLTNSYVYRNDFAEILIIFLIFVFVIYFIVSKLLKTLFRGFKKW